MTTIYVFQMEGIRLGGYPRSLEWAKAETGAIFIVRWLQFCWVNTAAQLMPLEFMGSITVFPGGPGLTAPGSTRKCFFPLNSPYLRLGTLARSPEREAGELWVNNSWTVAFYVSLSQRLPPRSGSSPPWRVILSDQAYSASADLPSRVKSFC